MSKVLGLDNCIFKLGELNVARALHGMFHLLFSFTMSKKCPLMHGLCPRNSMQAESGT